MFSLPKTATAPFCPSEVQGSIALSSHASSWRKWLTMAGPGLLVSIGYMDPGNWATDIESGAKYGYALLCIILLSSLSAMLLQTLCLRLGLVTGLDLAKACRQHYSPRINIGLWLMAEVSIIATDVAEVLGSALALHLLFNLSLLQGVAITAFDMLIILGLKGHGFRQIEAIILGLMLTIGLCFLVQLIMVGPNWSAVMQGFIPRINTLSQADAQLLAIGILGATVMPHNLYLHSSIVQTRKVERNTPALNEAIRFSTYDTVLSLSFAFFINAAILVLAASAFHATGHATVSEIQDAYHLLDPIVGSAIASMLFGIALLASGQSSTFTGTIAGQVIMEGFLSLKIPCWQRRCITRMIALLPAVIGICYLGESGIGKMLVVSQVILSMQLPFAVWPLIQFTSNPRFMGEHVSSKWITRVAYAIFLLVTAANLTLIYRWLS